MTEDDEAAETPEASEAEAVDDLMDNVAALLKSQMQTANEHLRKGAAQLLSLSRTGDDTHSAAD